MDAGHAQEGAKKGAAATLNAKLEKYIRPAESDITTRDYGGRLSNGAAEEDAVSQKEGI
jgi:hypothetical protein